MKSETKKILLLGAGGHCISVLDSLLSSYDYDSIGIIDKTAHSADYPDVMGVPVLGCDDDLTDLFKQGYTEAFITVGSIGNVSIRRKLYGLAKSIGFHFPNIIDKSGIVSSFASLGEGIYIGKNAVVNSCVTIGNCAIINTSCVIEHQSLLKDFVHAAPGCILCGNVEIGEDTHIGAGSVIKQGLHIGSGCMIGMGSVVLHDIGDKVTAYGNPCRKIK